MVNCAPQWNRGNEFLVVSREKASHKTRTVTLTRHYAVPERRRDKMETSIFSRESAFYTKKGGAFKV